MTISPVINAPAGFVPAQAIMFGALNGAPTGVDAGHPLPVAQIGTPATSVALAGMTAASTLAGPFVPQIGRPIWLCLSGNWSGTATLLRSTDGGVTRLPLTAGGQPWAAFTANANEPVAEENDPGATYHLDIALGAGTLSYRLSQ